MKKFWVKYALAMLVGVVVLGVSAPMAQATTVTVAISPGTTPYMFANAVLNFTATTSDGAGVTWSLATGSGQSKGALSNKTTTSVTYTAPSNVSSVHTVTLTATSTDSSSTATATITLETASSVTKTPIAGLVAMGDVSYSNKGGYPNNGMSEINKHTGIYTGAVINVLWSQLEPTQGVFDFSAIDGVLSPISGQNYANQGLAAITTYNGTYTPHVVGKIRIHVDGPPPTSGYYPGTPTFALAYGNTNSPAGFQINPNTGGAAQNIIGTYWATDTQAAYTALENELAAYYDANAQLEEVTVETCASIGGEPYEEATDATSFAALVATTDTAYNDANREACFAAAPTAYAAWKVTAIDSDYNRLSQIDGCLPPNTYTTGCVKQSAVPTNTNMANFAMPSTTRIANAVIANHDLAATISGGLTQFYPSFQTLGAPVEFQTLATNLAAADVCSAEETGLTYNMTEFEMHQTQDAGNGGEPLDSAELTILATILSTKNNPAYTCSNMPAYVSGQ